MLHSSVRATRTLVITMICMAVAVNAAPQPPLWGPTWFAPFDQSITFYAYQFNNSVDWYYDSTAQAPAVGQSLYVHSNGQHDEICTGVKGHETSDEPCSLLASSDSWRYVIYPESGECCRFCNTTDYCGIVAPDWLQQNATFVDVQPFGSLSCDGWVKQGGEQNFYYADLITRQPCEYYEGYPVLPLTSNYWRFQLERFHRDRLPAGIFDVPTGGADCTQPCAKSPMSYVDRLGARAAAGLSGIRTVG